MQSKVPIIKTHKIRSRKWWAKITSKSHLMTKPLRNISVTVTFSSYLNLQMMMRIVQHWKWSWSRMALTTSTLQQICVTLSTYKTKMIWLKEPHSILIFTFLKKETMPKLIKNRRWMHQKAKILIRCRTIWSRRKSWIEWIR